MNAGLLSFGLSGHKDNFYQNNIFVFENDVCKMTTIFVGLHCINYSNYHHQQQNNTPSATKTIMWRLSWPNALQWRNNEHDDVSNDQPHDCLLNRLFRCGSKKIQKFRVTGLCTGNSPVTGEFPAQRASNAGNESNWWRHHGFPRQRDTATLLQLRYHN